MWKSKSVHRSYSNFFIGLMLCLTVLGFAVGSIMAAGSWDNNWADSPDWGEHTWYNLNTQVRWYTKYKWVSTNLPTSNRRIELEWYDPGIGNFCDRLEPFYLDEYGGDWVDSWWTDNECGGGTHEELVFTLKENNLSKSVWYQVAANAVKKYTASYGGECNVSFSCGLCWNDDWLGKQSYTSSYDGNGSTP